MDHPELQDLVDAPRERLDVEHKAWLNLKDREVQAGLPVDITRKFGVNPPAGMYFDEFNFVPLTAVLGGDGIESRRARLKGREVVEAAMQFYESRPDLTRDSDPRDLG